MNVYVVSDLRQTHAPNYRPYWRVVGVFSSIIFAKRYADPNMSIITEHDAEENITVGGELPEIRKVVG
jgi:hypothetical protein